MNALAQTTPRGNHTDGADTRARILETAGRLFAENGFAQTANKAIAADAQVDLASINYHFGNREGLHRAVLIEAHSRIMSLQQLQQLAESPLPPEAKLAGLIRQIIANLLQNRGWHIDVLAQALVNAGSRKLVESAILPKAQAFRRILSQISGIPENDPALTLCQLSTMAPLLVLFVFGNDLPLPLQDLQNTPPDALAEHLHRYALAGLKTAGEAWRAAFNR
jgi:TetR/AcrR family transcriptional regulator, regulator of cefoperazone and chloramphenicol sensitivity